MAMRKLREAIVASRRHDLFAKSVYFFIIRTTVMLGHSESYHPALLYLFRCIYPCSILGKEEIVEFAGYLLLDLACRQNDLATAFRVRNMYNYRVQTVDKVLSALLHNNWVQFWDARTMASAYERRLISWADDTMANHAIRCL
ncbi:MAG: hypothetical protein Q9218_008398, partial [Villophora microphyllina]